MFTSVAIAQLAEQGKLGLDDPLGRFLQGFAPEAAEKVTIRHLLQMRSGWGDYWGNETYRATRNELRTVDDYLAFLREVPLGFEPGSQTAHSNTGFEILGGVIEKVSGLDYFEYVRRHIYRPAGMTRSDSYHRDGPASDLATGYTDLNPADAEKTGALWSNTFMLSPRGTPAGGGYATAEDLLRFRRALCGHELLGRDYTNLLLRRFDGEPGDPFQPEMPMMFAGGAPGLNALFAIDLVDGWTVVVLSNRDMPVAIELGRDIVRMVGR
jgi:CubicO group peptidase (beta-lactamase class C family)